MGLIKKFRAWWTAPKPAAPEPVSMPERMSQRLQALERQAELAKRHNVVGYVPPKPGKPRMPINKKPHVRIVGMWRDAANKNYFRVIEKHHGDSGIGYYIEHPDHSTMTTRFATVGQALEAMKLSPHALPVDPNAPEHVEPAPVVDEPKTEAPNVQETDERSRRLARHARFASRNV